MLAFAGCQDPFEPPDPTPTPVEPTLFGEHVAMGVGDGLPLCGASFEYAERFAELYLERSADGRPEEPVTYYYLDAETIAEPEICGTKRRACARYGAIYAPSPINTHEIVHALRQLQHDGRSPGIPLLEEGYAQWHHPIGVEWDDAFAPSQLPDYLGHGVPREFYDPGAQLMSALADSFTPELVEAFVDATADVETGSDVETVVAATLGVGLDELDEIYAGYPDCSAAARARLLVDCASEPLEWAPPLGYGGPWIVAGVGSFTCADARVIGPLEDRLIASYAIEVSVDGLYTLFVDVDVAQQLQLVSCEAACGDDIDLQWDTAHQEEEVSLTAGRYVVRLSRELGDEAAVGFRLYAPDP